MEKSTITTPTPQFIQSLSTDQLCLQHTALRYRHAFWCHRLAQSINNPAATIGDDTTINQRIMDIEEWLYALQYEVDSRNLNEKIPIYVLYQLINTGAKFTFNFL